MDMVRGRDPCPLVHPTHRRRPPRQLPRGAAQSGSTGQHEDDAFHGIVDLHALTITEEPGVVGQRTLELAAMLFAVGLDPDVATVFVQSHVPEHSQLAWVMECNVSFGELSRMTQFKDKSAKREGDFISAGLFTYPALQAADILLYDTDEVPVGDDQRQHVEITRDIAIRFNNRFGETFVVPAATTPKAGRPDHGPAEPAGQDVQVGRHRRRADPAARRPGDDRPQVQAGRHRLRERRPLRPGGQAGRQQPAGDPRRGHGPVARPTSPAATPSTGR